MFILAKLLYYVYIIFNITHTHIKWTMGHQNLTETILFEFLSLKNLYQKHFYTTNYKKKTKRFIIT